MKLFIQYSFIPFNIKKLAPVIKLEYRHISITVSVCVKTKDYTEAKKKKERKKRKTNISSSIINASVAFKEDIMPTVNRYRIEVT
jgi:hypothetical protein